jgi:hypothetical protein
VQLLPASSSACRHADDQHVVDVDALPDIDATDIDATDIEAFFGAMGAFTPRLAAAGVRPPGTLLGVSRRLAFPVLMVELEATAVV